jgi:hypothetical protein
MSEREEITGAGAERQGRFVPPRQGNHAGYYLPAECSDLPDGVPLYMAVAVWGLRLGEAFSVRDMCRAFRIDRRRGAGVRDYLTGAPPGVCCRQRVVRQGHGRREGLLQILSVRGAR